MLYRSSPNTCFSPMEEIGIYQEWKRLCQGLSTLAKCCPILAQPWSRHMGGSSPRQVMQPLLSAPMPIHGPPILQIHLSPQTQWSGPSGWSWHTPGTGRQWGKVLYFLPQLHPGVKIVSLLVNNNDKIQVAPKSTKEKRLLSLGGGGR